MSPDAPEAEYAAQQLCAAAGISRVDLKNLLVGPTIIVSSGMRTLAAQGAPLRFTLTRVVHVALMAELVRRFGIRARAAALIAAAFTDVPDEHLDGSLVVGEILAEDAPPSPGPPQREPGQLFPQGETYLVADRVPPDDEIGAARCIRVDAATHFADVVGAGAIVLNVTEIVERVRARLVLSKSAAAPPRKLKETAVA